MLEVFLAEGKFHEGSRPSFDQPGPAVEWLFLPTQRSHAVEAVEHHIALGDIFQDSEHFLPEEFK